MLVYFIPLGIHFWMDICEYLMMRKPALYSKVEKYIDGSSQLKLMKAKVEVFIMLYIIMTLILGNKFSLIMILFYGNFLRMKYIVDPNTRTAFANINNWIEAKIMNDPATPPKLKIIVEKMRLFFGYLVKFTKKKVFLNFINLIDILGD